MTRDRLEAFYRDGYVPDRLVVAAAGQRRRTTASTALVRDALRRPGRRPSAARPGRRRRSVRPRASYETRASEQVHLVWGSKGMGRKDPDRYALSVLSVLYGGGMSSRLFQEIREKRGLAYSIYSDEHLYLESGHVHGVRRHAGVETPPRSCKIVRDEAAKVAGGELTEDEVERAKGHVRGGLVLSMDDPGGRMSRLGRSELLHGEVLTVDELLDTRRRRDRRRTSTRVAKRIFAGGGAVLACVGPGGRKGLSTSPSSR